MLVDVVPSEIAATVSAKVMDNNTVVAFLLQYNHRGSGIGTHTIMTDTVTIHIHIHVLYCMQCTVYMYIHCTHALTLLYVYMYVGDVLWGIPYMAMCTLYNVHRCKHVHVYVRTMYMCTCIVKLAFTINDPLQLMICLVMFK